MTNCSFCGKKMKEGTGKMLVLNSNKIFYFCKKKCEKNWRMKRNPKNVKWTKKFRKLRDRK